MNNDENNRRPLAWVTGASGLIGSHVVQSAESYAPKWEIRGLSRKDFDLTDFPETQRQFEQDNPGLVIHCAAMNDQTSCEDERNVLCQSRQEESGFTVDEPCLVRFGFA